MKLIELKDILYSSRGNAQFAIVYSQAENRDLEDGCLVDHAVKKYAEQEVLRIEAFENRLVITI